MKKTGTSCRSIILKLITFIQTDIWRIRLATVSRRRSLLIRPLRIVLLALRGFDEDRCQLRASALTFYSLLSVVPIVAMAFGIAKGFGFEKLLEKQLLAKVPSQEEVLHRIIEFARSLLENTKGGMIAGIGVVILFWTVVKVLGHIEHAFNHIWGIEESRTLGRKFSDYLSVTFICPVLFIVSGSVTVFISTQVTLVTERVALLGLFSSVIFLFIRLLPFCVIWVLFTFVYIFMPNTKVNFKSGLLAGVIAGTTYQLVQWAYITFQMGAAKYNAIYGSFAALPLFLIWLQISWLIVLLGAEICFAHQNVDTYEFEPDCLNVSSAFKRLLSLQIMHLLVTEFHTGRRPLTDVKISRILDIPIRLVRQILHDLVGSGIVSKTKTEEERQSGYQPARSIETMTVKCVIDALEHRGVGDLPVAQTKEVKALSDTMQAFEQAIEQSPANKLMKDL